MLSADTNKSSGVYTCQTCNSLFTCLDVYQKHRRQHAQEEGVKLLTCAHCTYVSDNGFHYNWHIMSHASSPPHRCDVCAPNHQQISKEFPNQNSTIDDNGGNISNGLDCLNESHHDARNQSISSTIISDDGKRISIATETSDDLILPSQIYSSPSSSPTSTPFTTTTTLTTTSANNPDNHDEDQHESRPLNNQDDNASDTEIESNLDEETEDEVTAETDGEQSTIDSMNNQNNQLIQPSICDRSTVNTLQQQQSFYENDDEDDEDDEEEGGISENVFNGQNVEQIQYEFIPDPDCIEQQPVDSNGYSADMGDNEDDAHEFGDDDGQEYDDNENFKNNCDRMPPLPHHQPQPNSDVYDFNSDEDLDHGPYKLNISKSSMASAAALAMPNNSTQPSAPFNSSTLTNHHAIQLQSFLNASNQGLPIAAAAAAAAAAVANTGGDGNGNTATALPPFLAHPMNANFLFPGTPATNPFGPHNTSGQHHAHHGPTIFNPAAFATNGPIRLVSIQPFHQQTNGNAAHPSNAFLPSSAQTNSVTSNNNSMANLSSTSAGIANQAALNNHNHFQPNTSNNNNVSASKAVVAKKSPKKLPLITSSSTNGHENNSNTLNNNSNVTQTIITPAYQSMKGKGKGNRKPRISFVSVINGITVGADGIRRKFHCSHCGNGKSFKTKSHLQRHMLTHTGEKPYQCQECGAKFNQSSSLRNHIIAIHTKRFPHTCTVCGKGFLMPAVLQKHIQTTGHQSLMTDGTHISGSSMSEKHEDSSSSDLQQQQLRFATNHLSLQYSDSNNSNLPDENDDEDEKDQAIMNAMSFIKTEVCDDDENEEAENQINFKTQANKQNRLASSSHLNYLNSSNHTTSNSVSALNFASTAMAVQQHHHQQQQATSTTPSQSNLFFILANSTAS